MKLGWSVLIVRTSLVALALVVVTALVPARAARAQAEREVEAAKKRIQALIEKAEELRERGDLAAAQERLREAEHLKARLAKHLAGRQGGGRQWNDEQVEKILRGLEQGMAALRALGKRDALEMMERVTAGFKKELAGRRRHADQDDERAIGKKQIAIMRYALEGLIKAGHEKSADQLERAIHARRLALEGRRDDEAVRIRESAPSLGAQVELLALSARLLEKAGRADRARAVRELGEKFHAKFKKQRSGQERERQEARRALRIIRYAVDALFEAGKRDAADILEHAMHARELSLEGRRDDEAMRIRKSVPSPAQFVRALRLGAEILEDRGRREAAVGVLQIAERIQEAQGRDREHARRDQDREREHSDRPERRATADRLERTLHRLELLQEKLAHYRAEIEELKAELRQLKRRL